jgi:hypothetical protein
MYQADYKAILLSADLAREQYEGLTTHDSIQNSVNTHTHTKIHNGLHAHVPEMFLFKISDK